MKPDLLRLRKVESQRDVRMRDPNAQSRALLLMEDVHLDQVPGEINAFANEANRLRSLFGPWSSFEMLNERSKYRFGLWREGYCNIVFGHDYLPKSKRS